MKIQFHLPFWHHFHRHLGHFDPLHGIFRQELLAVKVAKESPDGSSIGLNGLRGQFGFLWPVEGVVSEFGGTLKRDDEAPEIISRDFSNILFFAQEFTEVTHT